MWNKLLKNTNCCLLPQDNFWCALREKSPSTQNWNDGAHRLTDRVERVDFLEWFFRKFLTESLIALLKGKDKAKKGTFCLIAKLFWKFSFDGRRLKIKHMTTRNASIYLYEVVADCFEHTPCNVDWASSSLPWEGHCVGPWGKPLCKIIAQCHWLMPCW